MSTSKRRVDEIMGIGRIGRTGLDGATDTKRKDVTVDAETIEKGIRIGGGNFSLGVRRAIKAYKEQK